MPGKSKPQICGIGQPLLDITATVGEGFLNRHGLDSNGSIVGTGSEHEDIFQEIVNYFPVAISPGGQTLNTIRCVKWMLGDSANCVFTGAIGKDEFGRLLMKQCDEARVESLLYVQQEEPTSTCAALINGSEGHRSMVSHLSGANTYPKDYLLQDGTWERVTQSQVYYTESYLLTSPDGPACMEALAKEARKHNKIFALNLSAPFIQQFFAKQFRHIVQYVDIIFGNETEAAAFAEHNGMVGATIDEIVLAMAALPSKKDTERMVIITQGAECTVVCQGDRITKYAVPKVAKVIDTTGAGDSFCGGYLSQLMLGKGEFDCVQAGHYAASVVIQRVGATYPDKAIKTLASCKDVQADPNNNSNATSNTQQQQGRSVVS